MKHLRKFNYIDKEYLEEFCQECLINLIDQGFNINIKLVNANYVVVSLYKPIEFSKPFNRTNISGFSWEEVKDDYIAFVKRLSKNYKVDDIYVEIWQHENVSMGNPTEKKFILNKHININTLEYNETTYNNKWGRYEPSIKTTIINLIIKD